MATAFVSFVSEGEGYDVMESLWYYDFLFSPKSSSTSLPHQYLSTSASMCDSCKSQEGKRLEEDRRKIKEEREKERDTIEGMFYLLDEDEDGRVSVSEMMNLLQRIGMGMPISEVEYLINGISENGVGHLSFDEFRELYGILFSEKDGYGDEDGAVKKAFSVFDANGDGLISAQELTEVLRRLGYDNRVFDEDLNSLNLIEKADRNGDGFIDFHEFKHFITSPHRIGHANEAPI